MYKLKKQSEEKDWEAQQYFVQRDLARLEEKLNFLMQQSLNFFTNDYFSLHGLILLAPVTRLLL